MALSAEHILAQAKKFELREVHIPAWADESGDDVVLVRGLSAKEWDAHQASMAVYRDGQQVGVDQGNVTAKLVIRCIVDAEGNRLFQDNQADVLGNLPITDMDKLGTAILELSGLTESAQDEIKGNSDAA